MHDELRAQETEALQAIAAASDAAALENVRIKYLGRNGIVAELFARMAALPSAEKPAAGKAMNALKTSLAAAFAARTQALAGSVGTTVARGSLDITLPGAIYRRGSLHPITQTINTICDIFISLGFQVVEGPEIESEYYNFETLNIPLEHPSRDAFDTFYVSTAAHRATATTRENFLLRSHTSPVQGRFMQSHTPPFSVIVPGTVYRPDATDASHSFMFHQVEGFVVGNNIHFSDLKGALTTFAQQMFGAKTKMRFRPSFFPFTEPSAEVDISCIICGGKPVAGKRCSVCGGKGWLEILGSGMINPKVFRAVGYPAHAYTGFAFGMGVERIAMLKYGISDIRTLFENDVRFLDQF